MQRQRSVVLFLVTGLVFAIPALAVVWSTEKLMLHATINSVHLELADVFFRMITHFADGLVPTVLALALLFFKDIRSFMMMGLGCGLSAIVVQFLKRSVFADVDRPAMFRAELGDMHWLVGLDLNHHFSFPSGHATAAFSMCLALAVIKGRAYLAIPFSLLAVVLAFSRVYLSQHFLEDILAGAMLGTITSLLVYHWLYRSRFADRPWLDRRLGQPPNQ